MFKKITSILTIIAAVMMIGDMDVIAAEQQSVVDENVEAVNIECVNEVVASPLLIADEKISVKERIQIGRANVPLYCTFDEPEVALANISENSVVQLIKNNFGYEDLSDDTWRQYYDAMYYMFDLPDCPSWYDERNLDFRQLRQFFDIYENEEKNNEIISLLSSDVAEMSITNNVSVLELLPFNSYLELSQQSQVLNNDLAMGVSASVGFDVTRGTSYAIQYATSPNKTDYDHFSADCTNFASQILENGGIQQDVYSSETSGWWHTKSTVLFITTHKQSISWVRADTFARYMGVGYSTTDHSKFIENIDAGDFIGADFGNDGDWNHMGYVTEKNTGATNRNDYKVAQHSNDYHEWASSSKNGWDTIGADGGLYGRVRR